MCGQYEKKGFYISYVINLMVHVTLAGAKFCHCLNIGKHVFERVGLRKGGPTHIKSGVGLDGAVPAAA